jgi:hypothetical protein
MNAKISGFFHAKIAYLSMLTSDMRVCEAYLYLEIADSITQEYSLKVDTKLFYFY